MSQFQIVKLTKGKTSLEVLGKPGMVTKYRNGECSLDAALVDDRVFSNSAKGEVPSEGDLAQFSCRGRELVELIMKTGKYSLTAAEKREEVERKHAQVVQFIHQNFVGANGLPHPVVRIENALEEIKARYDAEQDAERQARALIPKLQPIIRLQESSIEGTIVIPNSKLGQSLSVCMNFCTVMKEEYGPEHAYLTASIVPGKYDEFMNQISRVSQGMAEFRIAGAAATSESYVEQESTKVKRKAPRKGSNKNKH